MVFSLYILFQSQLERTEGEILELSHNAVNLKSNYLELTELRHVLEKTHAFFEEVNIKKRKKLPPSILYLFIFSFDGINPV